MAYISLNYRNIFHKTARLGEIFGLARLLLLVLCCGPVILQADQTTRQSLFKIERNTNANIVQYDAQLEPDGRLNRKKPVLVYWVRMAEQGQEKKLSWIQRRFVYGFKFDLDPDLESVNLKMAADIGRSISVQRRDGTYQATADIGGKPSRLEKMYIHATGKGLSTRVDFIELHGTALEAGDQTYERFVP